MSFKYVLHGDLSSDKKFNCRVEDGSAEELIKRFLPDQLLIHPVLNHVGTMHLCYYIQAYSDTSIGMSFYLRGEVYHGEDIKKNIRGCLAQVQYHIDFNNEDPEDDDITIKWVSVNGEENRGKGHARFLLSLALIQSHMIASSVIFTKLDDDSDAYANGIEDATERRKKQSQNLYCRMGYKYEDPSGGPEMIGDIKTLVSQIEGTFKKRKRGASSKKRKKRRSKRRKRSSRKTRRRRSSRSKRRKRRKRSSRRSFASK